MSIIVKNDKDVVQKVQYQEKGKVYGVPVDGQEVALYPFEEIFLQPGESVELDPVNSWVKVVDMGLGKADEASPYVG